MTNRDMKNQPFLGFLESKDIVTQKGLPRPVSHADNGQVSGFLGFWFQGFRVSGFRVSGFQGFWFQGFRVSNFGVQRSMFGVRCFYSHRKLDVRTCGYYPLVNFFEGRSLDR